MSDLVELIYIVFEEIKKAREENNQEILQKKEEELEKLRKDLAYASKTMGTVKF